MVIRLTKKQVRENFPTLLRRVDSEDRLPKRGKYNVPKVTINGEKWDSPAEYRRWVHLQILEKTGQISDLKRQVRFPFVINGIPICEYWSDSVYKEGGRTVVEDVKGVRTRIYLLKKKLMRAFYGVEIKEVRDERRRKKRGKRS